jgi:hypothetical protein
LFFCNLKKLGIPIGLIVFTKVFKFSKND